MSGARIVHLTTTAMSLDWLLLPQLRAFAEAGHDVIAMSGPDGHVEALEGAGIQHVPIEALTRALSPSRDLRALRQLRRAFERIRPDVVHTHNPKPGLLGRVAAGRAGVPWVVNTVHGLYATEDDGPLRRAVVYGLERLATSWSDAELVQNEEDLQVLRGLGVPDSKLTLLGNGIDLARFDPATVAPDSRSRIRAELGVAEDEIVVGAVGRLVWEKGFRELFAAAPALRDHGCRLVVVGPEERGKTTAVGPVARAAAERDGVRFAGHRSDMPDIYSALDVFAIASHREGFPRSAMEASAMGLPIVASDIRGCRQVVMDGRTGYLFPAGDVSGLLDHVLRLANDPGLRHEMGRAGRTRAEADFDDRRVIATTLRTYDWLLGARSLERAASARS